MTIIACSTYSFNQLITKGALTQLTSLEEAQKMGFDAIEIVDLIHDKNVTEEEYVYQLKAELDRLNLPITSFTFGADLLKKNHEDSKKEMNRIKKMIDYASILETPRIRHDVTWGEKGVTFDNVLPQLIESCQEIADYANKKGITSMVENHGFFVQDSSRMEKLYTGINQINFKLLADMGNFLCVDESPIDAMSKLAPYVGYAHVKDFHMKPGSETDPGESFFKTRGSNYLRGAIIGHGNVPILQCLSILKEAGYTGPLAIEFEGIEDNLKGLSISLNNLKKYLNLL